MKPIQYLDRTTGEFRTENVMGDAALRFAYETALGRTLWPVLFGGKFCSALMGLFYDSPMSRKAIRSLTDIPGCHPEEAEFPPDRYPSFNAFFARKLKSGARPADPAETVLVSPADGRLLVYPDISANDSIPVKGARRTLNEMCGGLLPDGQYTAAVIRLAPVDYHRYHFPCACVQEKDPVRIAGKYHSVNPIALLCHPDLFAENTREITVLGSTVFGRFLMIEVGAFGVGSIRRTSLPGQHRKMDEKGFFTFGGSTVILIFHADIVRFDEDLTDASARGLETLIRCGMRIAAV